MRPFFFSWSCMVAPQAQVLQVNPTETSEHNGIVVVPAEARFSSHLCNRVLKRKFKSLCGCCTTLLRGKNKPFSSLFSILSRTRKRRPKKAILERNNITCGVREGPRESHNFPCWKTMPASATLSPGAAATWQMAIIPNKGPIKLGYAMPTLFSLVWATAKIKNTLWMSRWSWHATNYLTVKRAVNVKAFYSMQCSVVKLRHTGPQEDIKQM